MRYHLHRKSFSYLFVVKINDFKSVSNKTGSRGDAVLRELAQARVAVGSAVRPLRCLPLQLLLTYDAGSISLTKQQENTYIQPHVKHTTLSGLRRSRVKEMLSN